MLIEQFLYILNISTPKVNFMFSIHVEHTIKKPIEQVFAILTEHEQYDQFKACDESSLLLEGKTHKNGDGALRQVRLGKVVFEESIFDYQPPMQFQYRIVSSKPFDLDHHLGEVKLTPVHGGTHVTWRSKGTVPNLLMGWIIEKYIQTQGPKGFKSILRQIDAM